MSTQKKTSASEVPNAPKKVVKFQCGLFREEIPFIGEDALCLTPEILQEYMCDLLDLRVCGVICLHCCLHHQVINQFVCILSSLNTHMETYPQNFFCTSTSKMIN